MATFNHIINDYVINYYMDVRHNKAHKLAKLREDLDKGEAKCLPTLGQIKKTPEVFMRILNDPLFEVDVDQALLRHALCDWGDICDEDKEMNDNSYSMEINNVNFNLTYFGQIMSVYHATDGTEFWIITEGDRSVTTVLFPHEY